MKIKFTGMVLADLAYVYYKFKGVKTNRIQAGKNFLRLRPDRVDLDLLEEAMQRVHFIQKKELISLRKEKKRQIVKNDCIC